MVLSIGCTRGRPVSTAPGAGDRSFVAAIANHAAKSGTMRVVVDPQPLPDHLEGPGAVPTRAALDGESPYAAIRDLEEVALRAASVEERERCAGILVLRDSLGTTHSGCPKQPYLLLVVGTPRWDTAEVRKLSSGGQSVPASQRWVRVLRTSFSTYGSSIMVSDYVIEPLGQKWRVVRRNDVLVLD